ncbi:type II toxin-antitoxin system Phd/YefM family antitoxin [Candidatus Peregrinibacteria bacterium]|jgi:PHD/YefM family antitoxin component YafN of YafNO toxin-antitoxin module|nr:type II toxin-antitoxin system Phd/YefM family antitoxin [Candidatus Peregrinibacteria bacterium]
MIKDRCVSVTDLRTNTKDCLDGLQRNPKYIFINNKPVAVLIDIQQYEDMFYETDLIELDEKNVSANMKNKAKKAAGLNESELVNL